MHYKVEDTIRKNRNFFIIAIILWLVLTIVFVVPLTYAIFKATQKGGFDSSKLVSMFGKAAVVPFKTFGVLFKKGLIGDWIVKELIFTILYSIFCFIGFSKSAPKHEYSDIEHGSSDWSKKGEQYKILNKNKGIILAEDNYLPVDKRGNVNVLVVGRIRFW